MSEVEETARKYFDANVTDRERAVFEGGITLGAIYHQFVGTPVTPDRDLVKTLEKAMERTMELQPHKTAVKVKIDVDGMKKHLKENPYGYQTLKGEHLDVEVKTRYGKAKATLRMRHIPELNYTLMYIEHVCDIP